MTNYLDKEQKKKENNGCNDDSCTVQSLPDACHWKTDWGCFGYPLSFKVQFYSYKTAVHCSDEKDLSLNQAVCIRTRRIHARCTHIQHENNTCLFFKLSCDLKIKVTKTDMKAYRLSKVTIMQNSKEHTNLNTWENINHCCCCTRKCFK